ncbi:MAG: hypothetical protein SOR95_02340 [Sutterella sp.]|nr:hypothetical protein [Sutterella sp.]
MTDLFHAQSTLTTVGNLLLVGPQENDTSNPNFTEGNISFEALRESFYNHFCFPFSPDYVPVHCHVLYRLCEDPNASTQIDYEAAQGTQDTLERRNFDWRSLLSTQPTVGGQRCADHIGVVFLYLSQLLEKGDFETFVESAPLLRDISLKFAELVAAKEDPYAKHVYHWLSVVNTQVL